jgi:hypothetical protein
MRMLWSQVTGGACRGSEGDDKRGDAPDGEGDLERCRLLPPCGRPSHGEVMDQQGDDGMDSRCQPGLMFSAPCQSHARKKVCIEEKSVRVGEAAQMTT